MNGTKIFYILSDHLNTPRKVTDDAGTVLWSWNSDAFGTTLPNEDVDGNGKEFEFNLRFPGQYFDSESGKHYNYFRDYEPSTGRYLQSDPIGIFGGVNTFSYVDQNPLIYVDFNGRNGHGPGGPWHPPTGFKTKCRFGDSCSTIKGKILVLEKMIKSHSGWDVVMPAPRGGGKHKSDIGDLWIQLNKCRTDYALKCNKSFCEKNVKTCGVAVAAGAAAWGLVKFVGKCSLVLAGGT